MTYSVLSVADDFMLEPEELKSIFDTFFDDLEIKLQQAEIIVSDLTAAPDQKFQELMGIFHAIKGAAYNLRMNDIGDLSYRLETAAKAKESLGLSSQIDELKKMVKQIEVDIKVFYSQHGKRQ